MIESIYSYYKNHAKLADENNLKILTFLGTLSLNYNYDFTFKDQKIILNIEPQEKEFTHDEEYKLFCINKSIDYIKDLSQMNGFISMFYELGNTFTKNSQDLRKYFEEFFNEYEENYKDYTCNKIVFIKPNVFYLHFDEELSREQLETLKKVNNSEVNHFEVYKNEHNEMELF